MGLIYLLCFDRSYRHARHYLGYTENLEARLAAHRAGRGSPLVAAAVRDGIDVSARRYLARRSHRGATASSLPQLAAAAMPDLPPAARAQRAGRRRGRGHRHERAL